MNAWNKNLYTYPAKFRNDNVFTMSDEKKQMDFIKIKTEMKIFNKTMRTFSK